MYLKCLGNWDTLEVKPKEKGLDTRLELIRFYEEYYSANIMHLVVYAKGRSFVLIIVFLFYILDLVLSQLNDFCSST